MWRLRGEDSLDSEPVGRGHEGRGPVGRPAWSRGGRQASWGEAGGGRRNRAGRAPGAGPGAGWKTAPGPESRRGAPRKPLGP